MPETLKRVHPSLIFITGERLMKKYDVDAFELVQMVLIGGLPVYGRKTREPIPKTLRNIGIIEYNVEKLLFKPIEFYDFYENVEEPIVSDKANGKVFYCPPGTKWKDIKITLLSYKKVRIKTPKKENSYAFHELGMLNKTTKKPKKFWTVLIALAKNQGFVNLDNIKDNDLSKKLIKRASLLNKHLKNIFGINESIYDGTYNKRKKISVGYNNFGKEIFEYKKGYKTKIVFSDATTVSTNYNRDIDNNHKSLFDQEVESAKSKINFPEPKKY